MPGLPRLHCPPALEGVPRLSRVRRPTHLPRPTVPLLLQPLANPLLYFFNFMLAPNPSAQQVPCPGSWFEELEDDAALTALPAALGSFDDCDRSF